jgi:hypothetical protein
MFILTRRRSFVSGLMSTLITFYTYVLRFTSVWEKGVEGAEMLIDGRRQRKYSSYLEPLLSKSLITLSHVACR